MLISGHGLLHNALGVDIVIGEKEYPTKAIKKPSKKMEAYSAYPHKSIQSIVLIHNFALVSMAITSCTDLKTGP